MRPSRCAPPPTPSAAGANLLLRIWNYTFWCWATSQRLDGEIRNVHGIRCRRMGPYTLVDLHMQVDPLLSVSAAHQAEARVRRLVQQQVRAGLLAPWVRKAC